MTEFNKRNRNGYFVGRHGEAATSSVSDFTIILIDGIVSGESLNCWKTAQEQRRTVAAPRIVGQEDNAQFASIASEQLDRKLRQSIPGKIEFTQMSESTESGRTMVR